MHRIDGYGNLSGMFTEGDPSTSTPATIVTDDWANAVQEEIVNAISFDGTALNKADNTQLVDAIQRMLPKRWGVWVLGDNYTALADFDAATPIRVDDMFTHNGGIMYANAIPGSFSILFAMQVNVKTSSYVSFTTYTSDDATFLYIDGVLEHTYTAGTGFDIQTYSANLSAGNHKIEILHNNSGGDNVDLILAPFIDGNVVTYVSAERV